MSPIVRKFEHSEDELPDFTTLCTRKQELKMEVWRTLLVLPADLFDHGDIQEINSTSFAYRVANRNYANRIGDNHESVKSTALVDCETGAVLDVHCSMSLPHDIHIAWQVLMRNLSNLETVVTNEGFDWDDLRQMLRDEGVKPVIKH